MVLSAALGRREELSTPLKPKEGLSGPAAQVSAERHGANLGHPQLAARDDKMKENSSLVAALLGISPAGSRLRSRPQKRLNFDSGRDFMSGLAQG